MSEMTPDLHGTGQKDEQPTLLQWQNQPAAEAINTGIRAVSAAPRLEVGPVPLTRIAHYELIKEVGRGGMGVVFKARDVKLNRIVALKVIRGGALANSDELQRFDKEATAAAQLHHPNIVALFDCDVHNQQPYLSMEFIGGTSLSERVSLGPLSGRRAAEYLELTARAVHYAHTRGIVHRDLKPANVLLDENDQPKVTDFGLAKQLQTDSDQTRTGAVLGTPSYMSPEQAAGRKDISPSSDVYSLGAILYELITGKPPFCGETPLATLNLVAEQEPIPPRVLAPTVDRDLETICLKCLEKTPGRRYASAETLADDLHRYLQGEPITARRVSIVGRAVKFVRRNPAWSSLVSASIVSVAAFMAFSWYEVYVAKELRQQAVDAKDKSATRLEAMRHLLYLSEMRQALQTLRRADVDGVNRILHGHWQPKEGVTDLRDWEWYFLKDRAENRLAFGSHQGQGFAVAYAPDGKQIASAGGDLNRDGEVKIWDVRTGRLLRTLLGHTNAVKALAYHPDKPILATASLDKTVKLWDLLTGKEIVTLRGHFDSVYDVAFSPKGDRVASASHDQTVRVWDYARFEADPKGSEVILKGHEKPVTSVAFHPNGQWLASASSDRTAKTGSNERAIKVWNLATGTLEKNLTGHAGDVESLAFTANGKILVAGGGQGSQRGEVIFWDFETGKINDRRFGLSDRILHVATSRDGKIAAAGADGLLRVWNPKASSEPLTFRADPQTLTGVSFAPDGFTLATTGASGRVSLWNSSAGSETLSLSAPGAMKTVAFNPKGPYLASAGTPLGDVRIWNLEHPEQLIIVKGHTGGVFSVAFSPDGKYLASGGGDHTVRVVNFLHPDQPAIDIKDLPSRVHALAYRPDGSMIASAGEDDDDIQLHDPTTSKLLHKLVGHKNGVTCLAFSPDGKWLASGSFDKTVRLWNLDTGADYILEGHTMSVNALAFNSVKDDNGKDIITLASASSDKTILFWDIETRKQLFKLEGTPGPVQSLAFHPRGRRLVSIGQDRMIRIWDLVTRQEILEFEEHVGTLRCVAFSADGRSLAAAGNGVVRVWQASREMPDARR